MKTKKMQLALANLAEYQEQNSQGGSAKLTERHLAKGKMLARDRIDALLDQESFMELGSAARATSQRIDGRSLSEEESPCDGAVVGYGEVHGRPVAVYASDFTVLAGSLGTQHVTKMVKLFEYAGQNEIPMVWLLDSAGGRLGWEDVASTGLDWFFWAEGQFSGVVPQITVLMGPCIAGQAYAPCMTDFLFMTRGTAHLWLGGPRMTQAATSEKMDDEVGSGDYHMALSGSCDKVGQTDAETIVHTRQLLKYLPTSFREELPVRSSNDPADRLTPGLVDLVTQDEQAAYNIRGVIREIVDEGEFFELKETYAPQLVTVFASMYGQSVGIVACNPEVQESLMTRDACDKYYRFLQVLDAYNISLVNLVDTPDCLPNADEESLGAMRHGSKLMHLYANCTIPKITIVLGKIIGDAGGLSMGATKGTGADFIFAWPTAEYAISASQMDLTQVVSLGVLADDYYQYVQAARERLDAFEAAYAPTAQLIDEIIHPRDTRRYIIRALQLLKRKRERLPDKATSHGTPPV